MNRNTQTSQKMYRHIYIYIYMYIVYIGSIYRIEQTTENKYLYR